jgi:GntR family transcriptional regulator / MocR family aminotransferase
MHQPRRGQSGYGGEPDERDLRAPEVMQADVAEHVSNARMDSPRRIAERCRGHSDSDISCRWCASIPTFLCFDMTTASATNALRGIATLVAVDMRSPTPLYRQIYESCRARILSSELRVGQRLPSSRELARQLGVSRLPVLNAYAQLLAEGYFETRAGNGTFVARSLPVSVRSDIKSGSSGARTPQRPISIRASAIPRYEAPSWADRLGPFQIGQPALQEFPLALWSKVASRCARRLTRGALRYGSPMGLDELRQVVAAYLRTSRGVRCTAEQVMIVSGSQQALDLATRVVLNPGDPVWIEEPGYWLARHVLQGAGVRLVPVPVDVNGLTVDRGVELCRHARAAFVAPSHQFPLGVTMSATRRLQLLDWAQRAGAWIVEDDYDSEYRYDRMPIASLQGLDENARVIYVGTFSKVLFPALRLGYLVIPGDLVERFAAVRQSTDLGVPYETQHTVAEFMRAGHFARHIRRMRAIYADRRRVLVDAIEAELSGSCTVVGADAGLHLSLLMRRPVSDREVAAAALQRKLLLLPLSQSYCGNLSRSGFVLGFGNSPAARIPDAVRLLKASLHETGAFSPSRSSARPSHHARRES